MSDNNTPDTSFNIAGRVFPATIVELDKSRRVDDPATGKKKTEKYKLPVVMPEFTTVGEASSLFVALCNAADAREAGLGIKLAQHLLYPQLEDADNAALNKDTGVLDPEKWLLVASSAERPRSAGQSIESINEELAELAMELATLQSVGGGADGWKKLLKPDGSQQFNSIAEYALRMNEVILKINNLSQLAATRRAALAEAKAKREQKAAAAQAAAKAAASKVAADPTPEPAH